MPTQPKNHHSRRTFVTTVAGLGAAMAVSDWGSVQTALAQAATAAARQPPSPLANFSATEAADLTAAVERIMPSDETPGAREAGVVYFIDRAFSTFLKGELPNARRDLKDLTRRAKKRDRTAMSFAQLNPADQDAVLREIESTPLFGGLRFLTMVGMFANSSWGGNRDNVGWKLIGFEPHAIHTPPFGYYDAQEAKTRGGRRA